MSASVDPTGSAASAASAAPAASVTAVSTAAAPAAVGPYSQAVSTGSTGSTGSTVYISGQVPLDPATGALVEGGIQAQAERVLTNIGAILEAAREEPTGMGRRRQDHCPAGRYRRLQGRQRGLRPLLHRTGAARPRRLRRRRPPPGGEGRDRGGRSPALRRRADCTFPRRDRHFRTKATVPPSISFEKVDLDAEGTHGGACYPGNSPHAGRPARSGGRLPLRR